MAHDVLRALPCYRELHDRLVAGASVRDVARWLQEEQGQMADRKRDSVVRALFRYQADLNPTEKPLTDRRIVVQAKLDELAADVDEVAMLSKVANLQYGRLVFRRDLEQQIGFPQDKLHQDVTALSEMLVKLANLKFKLGIYKESERTVNVNHTVSTPQQLAALPEEQKRQATALAQRLMGQLFAATATPAEVVPVTVVDDSLTPLALPAPDDAAPPA